MPLSRIAVSLVLCFGTVGLFFELGWEAAPGTPVSDHEAEEIWGGACKRWKVTAMTCDISQANTCDKSAPGATTCKGVCDFNCDDTTFVAMYVEDPVGAEGNVEPQPANSQPCPTVKRKKCVYVGGLINDCRCGGLTGLTDETIYCRESNTFKAGCGS